MGTVYLAQQDRPRRVVALKLVRQGLMSPRMLRRFEHESEMLARLQHPGIAQIYEAGTTASGQPYFAMEYVRGVPLTAFASQHALTIRQRLELFAGLRGGSSCPPEGRDPSRPEAGERARAGERGNAGGEFVRGVPAEDPGLWHRQSTDADLETQTYQTEAGQLIGTIPYMSPEQVSGDAGEIDTRSDVYTLGVMLYELLIGRLPHALGDKTIPEAARTISEVEPAPLGGIDRAVAGRHPDHRSQGTGKGPGTPLSIGERPGDRHPAAPALRADPCSAAEPVIPVLQVRGEKSCGGGRRKAAVILLIGGIVATSRQAYKAEAARAVARDEADFARKANEFLTGMLAAASPEQGNDRELTVREMVDRSGGSTSASDGQQETNSRVAMSLHNTLSATYRALGRAPEAIVQAERAIELAAHLRGNNHVETIDARRTLAIALAEAGRLEESEALTRECLAKLEARFGTGDAEVAKARGELGRVLLECGKLAEAETTLQAAFSVLLTIEGERHADTLSAWTISAW